MLLRPLLAFVSCRASAQVQAVQVVQAVHEAHGRPWQLHVLSWLGRSQGC